MRSSAYFLNAGEAAARLGVSAKALRLYERRGLLRPLRTEAGWRVYGPNEMSRAAEIVALRALGFSLADVARALDVSSGGLEPALAAQQAMLEKRRRDLVGMIEEIAALRQRLMRGEAASPGELIRMVAPQDEVSAAFELPWPWGGELFELRRILPLTYITGPLGSGKTRLARRLAEELPKAQFLGLDRLGNDDAAVLGRLGANPAIRLRIERTLSLLMKDGATTSATLITLLAALESEGRAALVVDMVEQGLDAASQKALMAHLRRRAGRGRPLFLLTRSCAILDLASVGPDEAIILCPANHRPPIYVSPFPGALGYESVATCLAPPDVRARTEGVIAWRSHAA